MKHNRWLVILVIILIIINISFFLLLKFSKLDSLLQNHILNNFEKNLSVEIDIEHFSLNDKQIFANNIKINDKNGYYSLEIKQIHIDYNIFSFLFSKRNKTLGLPENAISNIRIYNPKLSINLIAKTTDNKFNMPELYNYFKNLTLSEGAIDFKLNYNEIILNYDFSNINININNNPITKSSIIEASSFKNNEIISAKILLEKNKKPIITTDFLNLSIQNINYKNIASINTNLFINLNFDKHNDYFIKFKDTKISFNNSILTKYPNSDVIIDSLIINGNENKAYLEIDKIVANQCYFSLYGSQDKPLNFSNTNFIINFKGNNIPLDYLIKDNNTTTNNIIGNADFNTIFTSKEKITTLKASIFSDSIAYYSEKLKDIHIELNSNNFPNENILINLNHSKFLNSILKGSGKLNLKQQQLQLNLYAKKLYYSINNIDMVFDMKSTFNYNVKSNNNYMLTTDIDSLNIKYGKYNLQNLNSLVTLNNEKIEINLSQESKSNLANDFIPIKNNTILNLKTKSWSSKSNFNNFNIKNLNQQFGNLKLNGELVVNSIDNKIKSLGNLQLGNNLIKDYYIKLLSDVSYNKEQDSLSVEINIDDSFFNYTPLSIDFSASGNKTLLKSHNLLINKVFNGSLLITNIDKLRYDFSINANKIPLKDISSLYLSRNLAKNFEGFLNLDFSLNNSRKTPLDFNISVDSLRYIPYASHSPFTDIDVKIKGSGQLSDIKIEKLDILKNNKTLVNSNLIIKDFGESIILKSQSNTLLEKFSQDNIMQGNLITDFTYQKENKNITANLSIIGNDLRYDKYFIDSVDIDIEQSKSGIKVNNFAITRQNEIDANIKGLLNYNIFTNTVLPTSDSLIVNINADLANYLKKLSKIFISGKADLAFTTYITMNEDGIVLNNGKINIQKAWLKILSQQELIDKINIEAEITNNSLIFKDLKARMGQGEIFFRNEISKQPEDNFELANLNLGIFYLKTDETGLLFHLPTYMPHSSVANAVIKGRYNDEAIITGPFDDIKIYGDIFFSNGSGIYPANSENILKMFNFVRTEIKSYQETQKSDYIEDKTILPFKLDLMMHFTKNCKYVTYPLDLKTTTDSYLHLLYDQGWFAYEADFKSEEGTVELFGTTFTVDYAQVRLNPYETLPTIFGSFYKKVADGTTITLEIYTDKTGEKSIWDSFRMTLNSDDFEDKTITQILAKLKYGKSLDDLSESQYQNIVQDEAIQMVSVGIGSALLDQYISPIENRIRKFLKLDSFNISPGFIQNLINSKTWKDTKEDNNESSTYNSNILLNNLTISMGKYITNNMFIEYNAIFQEGTDLANNTDTYLYQTIGLRYDLPLKLKVKYSYEINPDKQDNAHEIFLLRTFKF